MPAFHSLRPRTRLALAPVWAAFACGGSPSGPSGGVAFTIDHAWLDVPLAVLTNPWVAGMLLMIGLLGLFVELKVPGFGLPGIAGIVCLALLFGSQYLVGHATGLEVLLFLIGLILILLELAVLPGFGVVGVAGVGCTLLGLVLALQEGSFPDPRVPEEARALVDALVTISVGVIGFAAGGAIAIRMIPHAPGFRRLVLTSEVDDRHGFTAALPEDAELTGRTGRALSDLRPAGKIQIGERVLDASTEGEYLEAGERVRVIRTDGNRVLVERAKPT